MHKQMSKEWMSTVPFSTSLPGREEILAAEVKVERKEKVLKEKWSQ